MYLDPDTNAYKLALNVTTSCPNFLLKIFKKHCCLSVNYIEPPSAHKAHTNHNKVSTLMALLNEHTATKCCVFQALGGLHADKNRSPKCSDET